MSEAEIPNEPRSPLLTLADHYYAVSADMRRSAEWTMDVSERLSKIADKLCEENMSLHSLRTVAP